MSTFTRRERVKKGTAIGLGKQKAAIASRTGRLTRYYVQMYTKYLLALMYRRREGVKEKKLVRNIRNGSISERNQ